MWKKQKHYFVAWKNKGRLDEMSDDIARKKLFDMIEAGDISPEDGLRLLKAFEGFQSDEIIEESPVEAPEGISNAETVDTLNEPDEDESLKGDYPERKRFKQLKRWWLLPFGLGLFLTVMGAIWMYLGYESKGFAWGFWLSWLPFMLGVVIMALASLSSKAKWLHVRIREKKSNHNTNISLSFPLPLNATRWIFRNFGDKITAKHNFPIESIIDVLDKDLDEEEPFYVHVDDEDDEVEVFIG